MDQHSVPPKFNGYFTANANTPAPYSLHSKVMAGAIIVIFLVISFILMVHVYAKWFLQSSSRSYVICRRIEFVSPRSAASVHINTGLNKAAITQLPTFVYKSSFPVDNLEAGKLDESVTQPSLECAVCLSEFQENEKGRMLPSCKHTFHIECIDMWFFSHSTCPLCRTKVVPGVATSAGMAPTHEQHHEGEEEEAMEPSPGTTDTTEGNTVVSNYPCNVLFWGNQMQVVSSQVPSSSSLPSSRSLARALPQITIEIPPTEGNLPVNALGALSTKCTSEQEAGSSGLCASIKRIMSRQSSRHKSSTQEGYEESPK